MKTQSLKSKTTKGIIWNLIEKITVYGVQFIISIIIARILMPSDYGLIGMLTIFIALADMFIDSGFAKALIQKQDRSEIDFSTVFFFNLLVSSLVYILMFFLAPLIAEFYKTPELNAIIRVFFISIVIRSFALVQNVKLVIEINFKTRAIINSVAVILSGCVGLGMAYSGFGVWALVFQNIANGFFYVTMLWIFRSWRPKLVFSINSFKQLFKFGSKLLFAGTVATIVNNLYTVLIGKFLSAKDVGYYTRGTQTTNLLSNTITDVIQNVTFPVMTSIQDDNERLFQIYRKLIRFTMFLVLPVMVSFALIAEPFVRLFLTEKWLPAVPVIQWLCIARIFTPVSALNLNMLNAKGRSDLFMKVDLSKLPLTLGALLITFRYGIVTIVIGQTIVTFICFFINAYYPGKILGFGALKQLKEFSPMLIAIAIMTFVVYMVVKFIPFDILKIGCGLLLGFTVYYVSSYFLKINEINEINNLLWRIIKK